MEPINTDHSGTTPDISAIDTDVNAGDPPLLPTLEQVYRDHAPRVYSIARKMLANESDAEDVTQEVLLHLIRKLPTFRGESAFPTWLHRIVVNTALSHRRKLAVREEHRLGDPVETILEGHTETGPTRGAQPSPETVLVNGETRRLIEQAVEQLPDLYRQVFVLSDIEGLPNADIADRIGTSLPAVKSRLHRARALLREALAPHFEETLA